MIDYIVDEKIRVFISSKCGEKNQEYNIVRRALKTLLEETGIVKTYVFEDNTATSRSSIEEYINYLDDSDVCLFLIDNFSDISEGLLNEIQRAQKTNKKSLYLFLNDSHKEKTQVQKNLTGAKGIRYKEIFDFRDFINSGYKSVINDILAIYRDYSRIRICNSESSTTSPSQINEDVIIIPEFEMVNGIIAGLDLIHNKLINLIYGSDFRKEVKDTSNIDKYGLPLLELFLGEKRFEDVNIILLLEELKKNQDPKLHDLVELRWKAIQQYFTGNIDSAISDLERIHEKYYKDSHVPSWLLNDILIDLGNLKSIQDTGKNQYDFSIAEKIQNNKFVIHFPILDRFSSNFYEKIVEAQMKEAKSSPYTVFWGDEFGTLCKYIASHFVTAIFYGSYTHLSSTIHKLKTGIWNYSLGDRNIKNKLLILKLALMDNNTSELEKIFQQYKYVLSDCKYSEINELYLLANSRPVSYIRDWYKLLIFKEIGYYFSDEDFEKAKNEIVDLSEAWLKEDKPILALGTPIFDAFKNNSQRFPAETVYKLSIQLLKNGFLRFYDDMFDMLYAYGFTKISLATKTAFFEELSSFSSIAQTKNQNFNP